MLTTRVPYETIVDGVRSGRIRTKEELHRAKLEMCRAGLFAAPPSDAQLLAGVPQDLRPFVEPLLRSKPSRTASGVAVVAAMTKPYACPHGVCIYCPGGPRSNTPQSYLGSEPAARRGAQFGYDAYRQTRGRIDQLRAIGHPTDKVDFIILGGTFTTFPIPYREAFVKSCYDGLNGFEAPTLHEAMRGNETAEHRMVGLTVETKPERFEPDDVAHTMGLGVTRVEFGVQSTFDDILQAVNRGHTVDDVRRATLRAKDAGLKVCYHMMPGLPGSNRARDLDSFRRIFEDPDFRPDMVKIYPTLVLPGTGLHELWRRGEYEPLTTDEVVGIVAAAKAIVPPWARVQRIQREIGVPEIAAGLAAGNVRELARARMAREGQRCRCIRCREVGLRERAFTAGDVRLCRQDYDASGGRESFLSLEIDEDTLIGYARLRRGASGTYLRELKVFGRVVPIHERPRSDWQHRGFGRQLLDECVALASEHGDVAILVTSGVGVREYYRRYANDHGCAAVMDGPYVRLSLP